MRMINGLVTIGIWGFVFWALAQFTAGVFVPEYIVCNSETLIEAVSTFGAGIGVCLGMIYLLIKHYE